MFLASSEDIKAGDVLLDTSISFKARSVYLLIDSLGHQPGERYTPSITILTAATGWSRQVVRECLTELVNKNLARELEDHSDRFHILPFSPSPSSVFDSAVPEQTMDYHSILTRDELRALLK